MAPYQHSYPESVVQPIELQPKHLYKQWEESAQELAYTQLIQQQHDLERLNY